MSYYFRQVFDFISRSINEYPEIEAWYWDKVVHQILAGKPVIRRIESVYRDQVLAGVAILKNDPIQAERKICHLSVAQAYQSKGLGVRLFERSFEFLDTDKPFVTVSETKYPLYQRLFDHFGFELTSVRDSVYVPGIKEFGFNEFTRWY